MNTRLAQAVFLGIIQGLTEFLPVSSSGHLAIAQHFLPGFEQPGILLDVLLHLGTLIAVLAYFRRDLIALIRTVVGARLIAPLPKDTADLPAPGWSLLVGLVVASVPTGIIGFLLKSRVEEAFGSLRAVGAALLGTAVLLVLGDLAARRRAHVVGATGRSPLPEDPGLGQSLAIGFMQGLAVMPGLSRSGSTISAGLLVGLEGPAAARFSFLLSVPAVAGAALLELLQHRGEIAAASIGEIEGYLLGPLVAGVVGYACIGIMMQVVRKARLGYFAVYCALVGLALLAGTAWGWLS